MSFVRCVLILTVSVYETNKRNVRKNTETTASIADIQKRRLETINLIPENDNTQQTTDKAQNKTHHMKQEYYNNPHQNYT